jgi:hypothetical protein
MSRIEVEDVTKARGVANELYGEYTRHPPAYRWAVYLSVIVLILCVYSYPALRTASTTGSRHLPSVSAPDLGLYLSLSRMEKAQDGAFVEPYYRLRAPANSVGFFKFRSGPILFGLLTDLLGGRMWLALLVWNLFWWGFLCLAAIWLFRQFLPRAPTELVLAGLALLMLLNFGMLTPLVTAWRHFPSLAGFERVEIVYIRPFSPQISIPLLFCYLGLQIYALQRKSIAPWAAMAFLQFFAFAAFPYATLMMAGTTAVAASRYILSGTHKSSWRTVLVFLLVCAFADMSFLLYGHGGFRSGAPEQTSLIHLQLSVLPDMIGRLWVLMGVLVVATALSHNLIPEVKWPLLGLGLSNMVLVLGDAVVPERVLFLSDHFGYFVHPTIVILLIFLVSAYAPARGGASVALRVTSIAVVVFCILNGFLLAEGNYRRYLPDNVEQADMGRWLGRGEIAPNDLVVSQYDACVWVPLLSNAQVLYCRLAQCLLTPEQNREVQRLREVLYLYFDGKDGRWLETTSQFERYGFYYELSAKGEDRNERISAIRGEMRPLLERVENGDPAIRQYFRSFRRVWIVQNAQNPIFMDARLNSYLDTKERERVGSLLITSSTPK